MAGGEVGAGKRPPAEAALLEQHKAEGGYEQRQPDKRQPIVQVPTVHGRRAYCGGRSPGDLSHLLM